MRHSPRNAVIAAAALALAVVAINGRFRGDSSSYDTAGSNQPNTAPLVCVNPTKNGLPETIGFGMPDATGPSHMFKIFIPADATLHVEMDVTNDDRATVGWSAAGIGRIPAVNLNDYQPQSFMTRASFSFGTTGETSYKNNGTALFRGTNTTGQDQYYLLEGLVETTSGTRFNLAADLTLLNAPDGYTEPDC